MGNGAIFSHRLRCTAIHLASLRAMGDAPESLEVAMEVRPNRWGLFQNSQEWRSVFDEPKTALHSSQSNQSGNQTVRWILHDVTFHPELCGRGSLKSIAQWYGPSHTVSDFFFRRFLPFVGWFPCPSPVGALLRCCAAVPSDIWRPYRMWACGSCARAPITLCSRACVERCRPGDGYPCSEDAHECI